MKKLCNALSTRNCSAVLLWQASAKRREQLQFLYNITYDKTKTVLCGSADA